MTDEELLMYAAKANWSGDLDDMSTRYDEADGILYIHADNQDHNGRDREYRWNPLEEDHDALRLAVKLHIDIRHFMFERGYMDCLVDRLGRRFSEQLTNDPCAATRRAIVRAAAEIGKAMDAEGEKG